jgi:hypothetical protein
MRRLRSPLARSAAAFATILALAACQPVTVDGGGSTGTATATGNTPTGAGAAEATQELHDLSVKAGLSMAGYSRDRFHIWASQGDGCDTRDVVLKRQGKGVKTTSDCRITDGSWQSPYNLKTYTSPQSMDIDHVVPLGNAWLSGAKDWTDDQRKAFANDLTRPQLLAVDLSDNRSKGDQDPSQWKPPNHDFWCMYAEDWVTVKSYYKLSVTAAERSALDDMLGTCS